MVCTCTNHDVLGIFREQQYTINNFRGKKTNQINNFSKKTDKSTEKTDIKPNKKKKSINDVFSSH